MTKPRIGPRMRELADIVSSRPGISKAGALAAAGQPVRGKGYLRPIERTIAAGLVIEEKAHARLCRLFATELDQKIWHLRDELLHGGPTPERASEVLAEVAALRARQAADYAQAQQEAGQ